jgi:hypothetical protein
MIHWVICKEPELNKEMNDQIFQDIQTLDEIQKLRKETQFREDQRRKPVRDHLNMNDLNNNQVEDSSDSGKCYKIA